MAISAVVGGLVSEATGDKLGPDVDVDGATEGMDVEGG